MSKKLFKVKSNDKTSDSSIVKLDHKTHILKLPDTYIGSIEPTTEYLWNINTPNNQKQKQNNESISDSEIADDSIETTIFTKRDTTYIPGEYKIFDEIIVNALDQYIRTNEDSNCSDKVKNIKINVDKDMGKISVYNDGEGIKIEIHPKEKIYNPELIFGHLLTSTNYNENQLKHVGGKNGYGAKLTNIFSKEFIVETCDGKKNYTQKFLNNMSIIEKPSIKLNSKKQYTKITYSPDFSKFNTEGLSDDMVNIMKKRAYDMASCAKYANIYFNDEKLTYNFENYINCYIGNKSMTPRVFETVNSKWDIGLSLNSDQNFECISFVNGINTIKGGKHVDYICNQICKKLADVIKKKNKININPKFIKDNIILFIKCTIDNPSFSSQTKEFMTTNKDKFGSVCDINDKFITACTKVGIIERALEHYELKENKSLQKSDGKKQMRLKGIPKLEDANWAGTRKSQDCTLILTEGDSAKSMALAGMSVVGRDKYGVFPLKGKLLNVKDNINSKKLLENAEINNIKKIMGLQSNKEYNNVETLRYGKIMILADQDEDGIHIKGLLLNLFESLWPTLFKYNGFLTTMLTPVIKLRKKNSEKSFYSVKDFEKWKQKNDMKGWSTKYYKGLGTSTPKEAKEYFKQLKIVKYITKEDDEDGKNEDIESIQLAFSKNDNSANLRKTWLSDYDRNKTLDYSLKEVSIKQFINDELIHFSASDNVRSLPNIIDGFKPSQRKVIYGCLKRNLEKEIRVAQLAGYISENCAYHHGEASLQGTIVNMAHDFVGSNNINLLEPIGQFGTRIMGGKDSAQPRYIHTKLSPITKKLFISQDNALYDYNNDDGLIVEPLYYVPVLPVLLINGSQGIGTGWSTDIPCFNPVDIIDNIERFMKNEPLNEMIPYYKGFKGKIEKQGSNYISKGIYELQHNKIIIKELPIGVWTDNYKNYLETLVIDPKNKASKQILRYYNSYCNDLEVHFELICSQDIIDKYNVYSESIKMTKLEKLFKLVGHINVSNLVAFNENNKIVKYNNINEILVSYINVRLNYYVKRKEYLLGMLQSNISLLEVKVRFINEFIENTIIINNRSKQNIIEQLETGKYPLLDSISYNNISINNNDNDSNKDTISNELSIVESNNKYDYLLKMPIYNLTKDKIEEFNTQLADRKMEYNILENKNQTQLWDDDLMVLKQTCFKDTTKFKAKKHVLKLKNKAT